MHYRQGLFTTQTFKKKNFYTQHQEPDTYSHDDIMAMTRAEGDIPVTVMD